LCLEGKEFSIPSIARRFHQDDTGKPNHLLVLLLSRVGLVEHGWTGDATGSSRNGGSLGME
jgi:hypothetical protein